MLNPLWQSTETYLSYNSVVDKWGSASALHAVNDPKGLDRVSAAVVLNIIFPDVSTRQIIKDLELAHQSAIDKANIWKEKAR